MKAFRLADARDMTRAEMEDAIRARAQCVYAGENRFLARVLGYPKMFLDARDEGLAGHLALDGYWESWLTLFLARTVSPGMQAVDVGAHAGYHTLALAQLVGPGGSVVAVEPNPASAALLAANVALNGHAKTVAVHEIALGHLDQGTGRLCVPPGEPKNAHLTQDEAAPGLGVATRSLDALVGATGRVDFLKIDAEGSEAMILEGAMRTLRRERPSIVLEYNARRYRDPAAILAPLIALYGTVSRIDDEGEAVPADPAAIAADPSGEDALLFLARP